jgi:hypothetical protein
VRVYGLDDARTLWFATLAILLESPSDLAAGSAVRRARSAFRRLALERETARADETAAANPMRGAPEVAAPQLERSLDSARLAKPDDARNLTTDWEEAPADHSGDAGRAQFSSRAPGDTSAPPPAPVPASTAFRYDFGLATGAAGLLFLLNALKQLGIEQALAAGLAWADPCFPTRVLQHLAARAAVADDDPILTWVNSQITVGELAFLRCDPAWWPSNLHPSRDSAPLEYVVRLWSLAVHRWCWRTGRITARKIIARPGLLSANRTDLDLSLPLDEADLRIRRIGLDLDPGWLPWLGRVVRFHYLARGEFNA